MPRTELPIEIEDRDFNDPHLVIGTVLGLLPSPGIDQFRILIHGAHMTV